MHPRLAAQRTTTQQKQGTDELPIIEMSEGFRLRPSVAATGTKVYLSGAAPWPLDTRQASLVARNGLPFDIGQCSWCFFGGGLFSYCCWLRFNVLPRRHEFMTPACHRHPFCLVRQKLMLLCDSRAPGYEFL